MSVPSVLKTESVYIQLITEMETKETTYAQETIKKCISEIKEKENDFQDYNESYSDYTYYDASGW